MLLWFLTSSSILTHHHWDALPLRMNDLNKIRQYMPQAVYKQIECGQGPSWRLSTEASVCQLHSFIQNIQKDSKAFTIWLFNIAMENHPF